jgi:hypothetical protein
MNRDPGASACSAQPHPSGQVTVHAPNSGAVRGQGGKHHNDDQAPGGQAEYGDFVVLHGQHERPAEEQLSIFERSREPA